LVNGKPYFWQEDGKAFFRGIAVFGGRVLPCHDGAHGVTRPTAPGARQDFWISGRLRFPREMKRTRAASLRGARGAKPTKIK
jgi:hypothetical protein